MVFDGSMLTRKVSPPPSHDLDCTLTNLEIFDSGAQLKCFNKSVVVVATAVEKTNPNLRDDVSLPRFIYTRFKNPRLLLHRDLPSLIVNINELGHLL